MLKVGEAIHRYQLTLHFIDKFHLYALANHLHADLVDHGVSNESHHPFGYIHIHQKTPHHRPFRDFQYEGQDQYCAQPTPFAHYQYRE